MRIFLPLLLSIILFGCHEPEKQGHASKNDFNIPDNDLVNDVVRAVISQQTIVHHYDSTGQAITKPFWVLHYNSLDGLPLSIDLLKNNIVLSEPEYADLFDSTKPYHFDKADSLYFILQKNMLSPFKVDTAAIPGVKFTSIIKLKNIRHKGGYMYHYTLTIPVFSADKELAYVELGDYTGFAHGYGFFLKKIDGEWKIVDQHMTWMS